MNEHRHDYSDANAQNKPMQAGTKMFVQHLLQRQFPDAMSHDVVCKLKHGSELSVDYLDKYGFDRPILVENKHELEFVMPNSDEINLTKIENIVGSDYQIDVIDVERQESFPMSINELNEYFNAESRLKTYNLISFEISKTNLTKDIKAPRIVYDISWASNNIWPLQQADASENGSNISEQQAVVESTWSTSKPGFIAKPEVQKYCLISARNSYTDFHIDFGGSSVWYHTVKGDKVFYLIEPTEENLLIYENWLTIKNHSEIFLGDRVKVCYRFFVKEGSTIFLPTGWIHAVYTPFDSLVFGGNFLQSYNIPLQIKIYEMEMRLRTPEKFRFPAFETFQWYAAKYFTQKLKEANSERKCLQLKLFNDLRFLRDTLKRWLNSKNFYELHDYQIPRQINGEKLVNVMNRELTKSELLLKSNNLYKSDSSLKIKLKLNPTNLASSTSQLVASATEAKKQKEILKLPAEQEIVGIKIDEINEMETKPAPIILKIPKIFAETSELKPIKIKLNKEGYAINKTLEAESEGELTNEDDMLINELKNSYQDNDFIYPSLTSCGQTARTLKKQQNAKIKAAQPQPATDPPRDATKPQRKRKLKPHAVEYLQPAAAAITNEQIDLMDSTEASKKPKNTLEKLIEKNLSHEKQVDEEVNGNDVKSMDDDLDYNVDDEDAADDDDYDQDFKIKCEQNLKLSKKLKQNSVKHQKKLQVQETSLSVKSEVAVKPTIKKNKKGYATTKQRLGKLLKLNRLVNI